MTDLNKKKHKRWGKKHKDTRVWRVYNEQLVKRGEYFLALDFVEGWDDELIDMNAGKIGRPYRFPKTLITLQALWHAKRIPYRMIEGMTRDLVKLGSLPEYNDYSTVNRRFNQLDFRLAPPQGDNITVFSDGTGLQAIAGGEYLREKYGKKNRRWIQIVVLGDAKTHEPISYEIRLVPASESESTERQLDALLKQGVPIVAAGGDGAMDDKHLFNFCDDQDLQPIIKSDKNARSDTDCAPRNREVKLRNKLGYKRWARRRGYGHRWPATEGIFSAIKRIFGEQLLATSEQGLLHEAASKIWAYQKLKRYGEA
jgi:hypothetical protein